MGASALCYPSSLHSGLVWSKPSSGSFTASCDLTARSPCSRRDLGLCSRSFCQQINRQSVLRVSVWTHLSLLINTVASLLSPRSGQSTGTHARARPTGHGAFSTRGVTASQAQGHPPAPSAAVALAIRHCKEHKNAASMAPKRPEKGHLFSPWELKQECRVSAFVTSAGSLLVR